VKEPDRASRTGERGFIDGEESVDERRSSSADFSRLGGRFAFNFARI
jgi:hypothetical protein